MIKYKVFPFRHTLFFIPILFLGIIYHQAISHVLFFDPYAPDLAQLDGLAIKHDYLMSMLSINNSLYEYGFFQSFLFPLLIIWVGYSYDFIKRRYLKFTIGKEGNYHCKLFLLKVQMGSLIVIFFSLMLLVVIAVGVLVQRTEYSQLEFYFDATSPIRFFARNVWLYLGYYWLVKATALFMQTCFICFLIDYYMTFTKGALFYLFVMWGLAPILYAFVPFYLVPMSNLMITTYGGVTLWQIGMTYLPFVLIYLLSKARKVYEVA